MSKIEGHSDLIRDDMNSAIINNDRTGFLQARRAKQLRQTQKDEINTLLTKLYSVISLGISWIISEHSKTENPSSSQINLLGISIGRRTSFFFEFGYGNLGILNMGVTRRL